MWQQNMEPILMKYNHGEIMPAPHKAPAQPFPDITDRSVELREI
jgi:hypothetical protein